VILVAETLRILILEDSPADAELISRECDTMDGPVHSEVFMTADELRGALGSGEWDVVVSDYSMPGFTAIEALEITKSLRPEIPFVVTSGTIGEERAVELLRSGASDYVMKEHLGRLGSVVRRAVREAREHALLDDAQQRLVRAGREWLDTFNAISDGILMLDGEGIVRRMNLAASRLLELSPADIEGHSARNVFSRVCPEADQLLGGDALLPERFEVGPCVHNGKWFDTSCDPLDKHEHPATGYVLVFTDITSRKRSEEELRSLLARLSRTMDGTVAIAVRMVESRDPYTAGHQERVSELAVGIAERLGLGPDEVELIRIAALLHDVGKIAVPAEILVRPGELQDLEWELIKRHPAVGAEILKDAEFDGPISEIVHQHHERLDGSGYPCGLSGAQICREAQIVAVADVTEAMTAHRPYRPACADEQVVSELTLGRGIKYAPDVVDACLDHLRDNNACRLP